MTIQTQSQKDFMFPEYMIYNHDIFLLPDQQRKTFSPIVNRLIRADIDGARLAAERLYNQNPEQNSIKIEFARFLILENQLQRAMDILNDVIDTNPSSIEAYKLIAYVFLQQGDPLESLAWFGKAISCTPSDTFAQINCHALRLKLRPQKKKIIHEKVYPVIATSIPPARMDLSKKAIQSWIEQGFHIISVNTFSEKEKLAPEFPQVEFMVCNKTACRQFGKDYQYLDTLLDALASSGSSVCGLINSDIILHGEPEVWNQLCYEAKTKFIYGSRVNVSEEYAKQGLFLEPGFDYFFFPSSFLRHLPSTGFVFGQPAWDLFLPAWIFRCDLPIAFCYSPVAKHIIHPVQWSPTANARFMTMALSFFSPELSKIMTQDKGCHIYMGLFTEAMARILNKSIKSQAHPFFCISNTMDTCFAPLDPFYILRGIEETLLFIG
jgi:tetratricopeptide (TPR) repeat protein